MFPMMAGKIGSIEGCPARSMVWVSSLVNFAILGSLAAEVGPQRDLIWGYLVAQFVWTGGWFMPHEVWRGILTRMIIQWKSPLAFNRADYLATRYQRWDPTKSTDSYLNRVLIRLAMFLPSSTVVEDIFLVDTDMGLTTADFSFIPGRSAEECAITSTVLRHLGECHFILGADVFNVLIAAVPPHHLLYRILATVLAGTNSILYESMSTNIAWARYLKPGYDLHDAVLQHTKNFDYVRYQAERFQSPEMQAYRNCLDKFVAVLVSDEHTKLFLSLLSTQWNGSLPVDLDIKVVTVDIIMSGTIYHELYGHAYTRSRCSLEPLLGHPAVGATAILGWGVRNKVADYTLLFTDEPELAIMAKTLKKTLCDTQTRLLAGPYANTLYLREPIEPVLMH